MSLKKALLSVVASSVLLVPAVANASFLDGLSLRGGFYHGVNSEVRDVIDFAAWGGGLEYKIVRFPQLLNGESWATTLSVDFHYSERGSTIVRVLPVSINQIFTFEEQGAITPYAGFCVTAMLIGGSDRYVAPTQLVSSRNGMNNGWHQPMITRWGAGLILGVNFARNLFLETRYEWIDGEDLAASPEGFRTYLGYRF
ncbi:MAG TPA: hypothetical protein VLH79_07680 [Chthonomonadales bacterium]|nr:hypothetical protein [Chthonomonadales bacterium]